MSKDIKKALEHCVEWKCDNCPNGDDLGSGETVCRGRLLPQVLEYVADLEAKLAEKQKLLEDSVDVHEMEEKDIYKLRYELAGATETIEVLKQQLVEKDKELETYKKQFNEQAGLCEEFRFQLAEKDKEIAEYKRVCTISHIEDLQVENMLLKGKDQDKISFAVEQLEQLRHDIWTNQADDGYTDMQVDLYDLNDTIDVRIMQIKEGK